MKKEQAWSLWPSRSSPSLFPGQGIAASMQKLAARLYQIVRRARGVIVWEHPADVTSLNDVIAELVPFGHMQESGVVAFKTSVLH
jgi:hypothetical protein